jgi:STE24 endopeptidase
LRHAGIAALLCATMALPAVAQTAPASASASASATASATAASGPAAARPTFQIRPVDDAWRAALPRDAQAATQAWLDRLPADVQARSNAYFEGGYWLQGWNFLLGLAVSAVLLWGRPSTAVRDWARAKFKRLVLADGVYGAFFVFAGWALSLPLTIYQGYLREHDYGMATQNFGAWFAEQLVMLAVSVGVSALVVALLYAVIRRAGERWWLWGTLAMVGVMCAGLVLGPVYVEPLFNTYKPVEEGPIKRAVIAMAQANGVPADNVYVFDASRQTTRVSANVSGLFGSAAVRLNDNLLRRASEAEIRAVMAHEIGHYALNHIPKMLLQFGLLIAAGFMFSAWAMRGLLARWGLRWRVAGVGDVATLPLLAAVFSVYLFAITPLTNTIIRTQEVEADLWGLNLAREPMGEAEVLLKLVEYRKADPGPVEEFVFFDHPSARTRIYNAMRWREQMQK